MAYAENLLIRGYRLWLGMQLEATFSVVSPLGHILSRASCGLMSNSTESKGAKLVIKNRLFYCFDKVVASKLCCSGISLTKCNQH